MITTRHGVPQVMPDNEAMYLKHVVSSLGVIDDNATLDIYKTNDGYSFTLRYSREKLQDLLIQEVRALHRNFGLNVQFSSFKDSPYITFRIHDLAR